MGMEIYLDLEKTILNENHILTKKSLFLLTKLCESHSCTILTNGALWEARELFNIPNIRIISTLEDTIYENGILKNIPLETKVFNELLLDSGIYTLYASSFDTCYILKYQERLKSFYPTQKIKISSSFPQHVSAIQMVVFVKDYERILSKLNGFTVHVLFSDHTKVFLNITKASATKESYLLKLKKSPAIGIGDSLSDYDFIQHCEIQIAMQNGEDELKKLCKYQTSKSCEEDGALEFIDSYLKHQQA